VLEGIYTGFSIGGYPTRATPIAKDGQRLRRIEDYVLEELSLVDVPANPRCVVTAITKRGSHLVATDVLGSLPTPTLAGDVLTLHHEVQQVMPNPQKRVKVASLVAFNKSLTSAKPEDEVLVAPISAFRKNAAGELVLDAKAQVAKMTKGELDGDGYDSDAEEPAAAPPEVDFDEHAGNLARAHEAMVKGAGLGDPEEHYRASIGTSEDETPGSEGTIGDEEGIGKSASRGKRKDRIAKSANDAKFAALRDELGGAATRREAAATTNDGERIAKSAGETVLGETADVSEAQDRLTKAYSRRDEMLAKGVFSSSERHEADLLAREIARLEVGITAATGKAAR
jgi:hypothetical protein